MTTQRLGPFDDFDLLVQSLLATTTSQETCLWTSEDGHACMETLSADLKLACAHFRNAHALRGDTKDKIACMWQNCTSPPVQRRNIIRHILSVHLELLKWTCPQCLKTLARKDTAHLCQPQEGESSQQE